MSPKPKVAGVGKLKKVKITADPKLKQFRLRMGTPNEMGEVIAVATEAKVRSDIIKNLRTVHQPWCKRFNNAGIKAIDGLVLDLTNSAIHLGKNDPTRPKLPGCQYNAGDRIQACIDERYGIVVAYEFWSEWTS